MNLISDSEDD